MRHPSYCCCDECAAALTLPTKTWQPEAFKGRRFRDALFEGHTCFDGDPECRVCADTLARRLADLARLADSRQP